MSRKKVVSRYRGVTLERYHQLLEKQNHVCAICHKAEGERNGRFYHLAVDHCHITHKIRGLLCSYCNRGLGQFKDNPNLLEKAAQYIRKHESNV